MNIWITGCSGFVGTRLANHFAKQHDVTGIARRDCAASRSVAIDLSTPKSPREIEKLSSESGPPEVVIHAASKQPGLGDLADFVDANVHATSNLIEGLTQHPPRLIVYTSTHSNAIRASSCCVCRVFTARARPIASSTALHALLNSAIQ